MLNHFVAKWPLVLLVLLTALGGLLRLAGLPTETGTLGRDETRLALAAQGLLDHGLPRLPGGLVYTRGLLPMSLEALSFAIFGRTDHAALLPTLVLGTLLIPAVYLLAGGGSSPLTALTAAAIVACSPPLVRQSREAWLYSSLLLFFVLALGWLRRARVTGSPGDRTRAAVATAAAMLSHEFATLLIPVALLHDLPTLRRPDAPRQLLAYWPIALWAVGMTAALSLGLRTPTIGGATTELGEYLQFGLDPDRVLERLQLLGTSHLWLLLLAVVGVAGRTPVLLVHLALAVVLGFCLFVLPRAEGERYIVLTVPLLAAAAARGVARLAPRLAAILLHRPLLGSRRAVAAVGLTSLVLASLDPARLEADIRGKNIPAAWLAALDRREPDDLVLSYSPTVTTYYLGRTDYWLRARNFNKYIWRGPPPLREIHSNAILIRTQDELRERVIEPNRGRVAWVIVDGDQAAGLERAGGLVYLALVELSEDEQRLPDGRAVLRVKL